MIQNGVMAVSVCRRVCRPSRDPIEKSECPAMFNCCPCLSPGFPSPIGRGMGRLSDTEKHTSTSELSKN